MAPWDPIPYPDADTTAALGGMTWAAIRLEAVAYRLAAILSRDSIDLAKRSVSDLKKDARKTLPGEPTQCETAALEWLGHTATALETRNYVLHSDLTTWFLDIDRDPTLTRSALVNRRFKKAHGVDVATFVKIAADFDAMYAAWPDIERGLLNSRI
ncbi:hypothetical protein E6C70_04610 [Glaciibacter flavus]|uniref:Uncharacterized protein n=1 Tax=Orlajensenia flava TaxID=2565934 RepID=A0A4S4FXN4_9MICO|nr:hypothetical protein [Glaciibacter flavus]THG35344.1 hypothetical protein E6C70_04610 [Glaciibacter flavus]